MIRFALNFFSFVTGGIRTSTLWVIHKNNDHRRMKPRLHVSQVKTGVQNKHVSGVRLLAIAASHEITNAVQTQHNRHPRRKGRGGSSRADWAEEAKSIAATVINATSEEMVKKELEKV